jgi:DNA-cytosine methyltransferase
VAPFAPGGGTFVELFACGGGFSAGLISAGWTQLAAVELNGDYIATLASNHKGPVFHCDVMTFAEHIARGNALVPARGEVDLLVGGPPCQGFSQANRHKSGHDAGNKLIESFIDHTRLLQPKFFIMENVVGLLNMGGGVFARDSIRAWQRLGYQVQVQVLRASSYGVAQNRWRLFIIGVRAGLPMPDVPCALFAQTERMRGQKHLPGFTSSFWWHSALQPGLDAILPPLTVDDIFTDLGQPLVVVWRTRSVMWGKALAPGSCCDGCGESKVSRYFDAENGKKTVLCMLCERRRHIPYKIVDKKSYLAACLSRGAPKWLYDHFGEKNSNFNRGERQLVWHEPASTRVCSMAVDGEIVWPGDCDGWPARPPSKGGGRKAKDVLDADKVTPCPVFWTVD